jgi:hypothetical protein
MDAASSWTTYKVTLLGMPGFGRQPTQAFMGFCRLLEALLSFLDFSDKKASTAVGLLTDLALEER